MVTRKRTGKVPIRTGTDFEILTSLTLYLIFGAKRIAFTKTDSILF